VNTLRRLNQALISERGALAFKYALVLSLCGLMVVAVVDARRGQFGPGPAAFAAGAAGR
jgi:hypothetical protein